MTPTACPSAADATKSGASHTVEFLYWEECPSHERALELLQDVLREERFPANIRMYRVETDDEAETLGFPGSPTIRIDGRDIDEMPDMPSGLTCRIYRLPNGRMSPLPTRDVLIQALRRAQSGSDNWDFSRGVPETPGHA